MGRTAWEDAPDAIRSWARKPIFDAAQQIVAATTKEKRRSMLARIPEKIRPHVEAEVVRLWNL